MGVVQRREHVLAPSAERFALANAKTSRDAENCRVRHVKHLSEFSGRNRWIRLDHSTDLVSVQYQRPTDSRRVVELIVACAKFPKPKLAAPQRDCVFAVNAANVRVRLRDASASAKLVEEDAANLHSLTDHFVLCGLRR